METRLYRKSFGRQVENEVNIGKTRLEKARLYIDDTPGLNTTEMQRQLEKVEEPLDLIIVDYLQIMGCDLDDSSSGALVNALKLKQIAIAKLLQLRKNSEKLEKTTQLTPKS